MKFFLFLMLIGFGSQAFSSEEFPGEGSNFIALQDVIIPSSVSETDVFYRKLSNSPGTYYGEQGCTLNVVPSSKVRRIPKDFKVKIKW